MFFSVSAPPWRCESCLEDDDECPEGEEAVPAGLQRLEAQLVQEGRVVREGAKPHGGPVLMNALMNELKIN